MPLKFICFTCRIVRIVWWSWCGQDSLNYEVAMENNFAKAHGDSMFFLALVNKLVKQRLVPQMIEGGVIDLKGSNSKVSLVYGQMNNHQVLITYYTSKYLIVSGFMTLSYLCTSSCTYRCTSSSLPYRTFSGRIFPWQTRPRCVIVYQTTVFHSCNWILKF